MQGNKTVDTFILRSLLVFGTGLLVMVLRKPPIKEWLLVFLFNASTNGLLDKLIVSYNNKLKYPTRLLPKIFKINILFDYLLYPTLTIVYNQLTAHDKPLKIFLKLFYFTIPVILVEFWAEQKTGLIKFRRGWKWYHSFLSLTIKSLFTRLIIGWVRKVGNKQNFGDSPPCR